MEKADYVLVLGFLGFLGFLAYLAFQNRQTQTYSPSYVQLPTSIGGKANG